MPENDELKKYLDYDGLDYLLKRIPRTRIIVTFDEVFAGETATCSLGTTTYTNTIPATEPYQLVFSVVELGVWSIETSYLGEEYGTTVEVTSVGTTATGHISYVTEIDGSTVTPTNDITIWLKCANIEDPSITTLANVLANRSLFETLIANSNACNYMVRSTNWAGDIADDYNAMALIGKYEYCSNTLIGNSTWLEAIANSDYIDNVLNVKVPVMTSNTTPSGVASASEAATGWEAYKSFDGNTSATSAWSTDVDYGAGNWLMYQFVNSVCINAIGITTRYSTDANMLKTYKIQGSNDAFTSDIHDLYEETLDNRDYGTIRRSFTNSSSYKYYRLYAVTDSYYNRGNISCLELQFYGRARSEILVPLVPTMTSDTTPSGECSASSITSGGYDAWRAFDGNDSANGWCPEISTTSLIGSWIKYAFPYQVKVDRIRALQKDSAPTDTTYKLEASNDDTNWTTISDSLTITKNSVVTFSDVTTSTKYSYYRITMLTNTVTGTTKGFKFQFYGKGVQTNIIHSAANDTIYMIENGSQIPLCTTDSNGDGILDFTQFIDGTYVLYSSVAKTSNNTSNDYSKSVRITKTSYGCTTEVYLMPDTVKTPYWFGNIFGKSVAGSLTKNTNYLYISGNNGYFYGNIQDVDFRGGISKVYLLISYDNNSTLILDESTAPSNIPTSVQPFYIAWYDNHSHTYNQYIVYKTSYGTDSYIFNRRNGKYYLRVHAIWME